MGGMQVRVLAVDPGYTSGIVVLNGVVGDDWRFAIEVETYEQVQIEEAPRVLEEKVSVADAVVCEKYVISTRTTKLTRQYEALYVIGGLVFLCELIGRPMRLQAAADAKTVFSDRVLQEQDWYHAVAGDHARDALRHGLLFFRRYGTTVLT